MSLWLRGTWAVFEKDLRLELRNRYTLNMLFLFVLATILMVLFATSQEALSPRLSAALLWIVILFATVIGLTRGFISEVEQETILLLQLHVTPASVYAGKLLFNTLLTLVLNLIALLAFLLILGVEVTRFDLLAVTLLLGSIGLSGATTLLSAIIAKATNRGPLLPVLAFPILVPLLLTVTSLTHVAFIGGTWVQVKQDLLSLIGYSGAVITASVLLFDYVWKD